MDAEELQTTALAALESADVAVLKRLIVRMLPYVERDVERRESQRDRTRKSRMSRDVTLRNVTRVTPPSPSPFPPSPSFPPHPPKTPYPLTPSPTPASPLAAQFADDDQRLAYERIRQAAKVPASVDATLRAVNGGITGGAGYGWPVIGQALVELEGAGGKFSAEAVRGFCRRLVAPPPNARGGSAQRDQNLAALQAYLNNSTNA